jgi:hypothetical protein
MHGGAIARTGAVVLVIAAGLAPAAAADLPDRKPGLWEITTGAGGHTVKVQQCIDAATDHAMQTRAGTVPHGDCSKRDVQKSTNTTTIDTVCNVAGKNRSSHIVITGSFDSEYSMTVTSHADGEPDRPAVTVSAKWLGPCAADQRPGDMIMPNGMKMNIQNMPAMPKGAGAPPGQ